MIANLVDNGIRHNERGGFLSVRTRSCGECVSVVVTNGGPRIDPDDARALTEPFRRLNRHGEGFGLGLSIVRSVVEAHGGCTRITAAEAGGLEVCVELPVTRRLATVGVLQTSPALT